MLKKLWSGLFGKNEPIANDDDGDFAQRRKSSRRNCEFNVDGMLGRRGFCATVVDMSAGGMKVQCSKPIGVKNKSVLKLTYPNPIKGCTNMTVECVARWSRMRESDGVQFVGVEFKDRKKIGSSWVKPKMKDLGFQSYNVREQRQDMRIACRLPASITVAGTKLKCAIRDIGLGGLYLELQKPLRGGAEVSVQVEGNSSFPATTFEAKVLHQQHPEPGAPFGHGVLFRSLSTEQTEQLKEYLLLQREKQWEDTSVELDFVYAPSLEQEEDELEDVEIPDLADIMEETEVAEEEIETEAVEPEEA